jgi:proteic killer suppression protein
MIKSFKDPATEASFNGSTDQGLPHGLAKVARRKLRYLNAAVTLSDLMAPPGNRLERLKGNRKGQHSIRINDQYRICFTWTPEGPTGVEITDYHS